MPSALAIGSDFLHISLMVLWALGLPFLLWHRWPRLSMAYTVYAITFVVVSQVSHHFLGECFLTTLSRHFWQAAGSGADGTFTGRLVIMVAGIRPSNETAVLIWESAIVLTAIAVCWSLFQHHHRRSRRRRGGRSLRHST